MADTAGWRALLARLLGKGKTVFDTSTVLEDPKGTKDPKVWALALLARTIGNVEGALVLLDSGHVVEARTLVRCCYERRLSRHAMFGARTTGKSPTWLRISRARQ